MIGGITENRNDDLSPNTTSTLLLLDPTLLPSIRWPFSSAPGSG